MRGSVPGGNEVAAWVKRQPSCCSRVARCRRTRVTAPKKSQTMPSRTTSAQSRHTATGWPSRSTTIDTTSQVPKSMPSHSGDSLAAGAWLHRAAAFCSLGESQRCSSCAMFIPYTIRNASTSTQRRRRTKVRALVTPSPVGVVMVMVVQPSPPSPSPAMHGPFLTKMLVSMAFAIWFMLSMLRECIAAVWWQPPSSCTARAMASSTFATRTTGSTGIISSVTANGWLAGVSTNSRRVCAGTCRPIAAAILPASRPTQSRLTVPLPRSSIFFSSSGWSCSACAAVSFTACWPSIRRISSSATLSTTISTFSSAQIMLLSNEAPLTIACAARGRSAVSSTTTGGLPAPAAIRRLLVCLRAASTTASPPVTTSRPMPGYLNSRWAVSISGFATVTSRLAGPPAATTAWLSRVIALCETFFAAGWGAKTTLLPAAIRLMALLITVAAGLVDGVTEATTPQGAFSISVRPLSPVSTCGVRHSTPGVPRACATFLANLSSTRPMPVSVTASSASSRAYFSPASRMA
ncbi:hypothetical protein UUU_30760 [Klebsiella pneumoniae subsp. pneumoniae DSM 30104 = JCM 1662 = NBRC 14940]|nr:hypothetical protein UUU_30760 [Klebsiella pneumoniae subsp. pneumoniae DSM 30104 = JCM 1662 = NBRC 14940]